LQSFNISQNSSSTIQQALTAAFSSIGASLACNSGPTSVVGAVISGQTASSSDPGGLQISTPNGSGSILVGSDFNPNPGNCTNYQFIQQGVNVFAYSGNTTCASSPSPVPARDPFAHTPACVTTIRHTHTHAHPLSKLTSIASQTPFRR
jgi:hypothetical protein